MKTYPSIEGKTYIIKNGALVEVMVEKGWRVSSVTISQPGSGFLSGSYQLMIDQDDQGNPRAVVAIGSDHSDHPVVVGIIERGFYTQITNTNMSVDGGNRDCMVVVTWEEAERYTEV